MHRQGFDMVELAGERVYEPDLEVELDLYYAYEPDLEVELELIADELTTAAGEIQARVPRTHLALAVATIVIDDAALEDEWFGEYDETREYIAPVDAFEDQPTSPFRKLGNWLLGRAA